MTARERLLDAISFTETANMGTTPEALLDDFRAEVLREGAEAVMVRAEQTQDMKARIGLGVAHYIFTELADAATPTSKETQR